MSVIWLGLIFWLATTGITQAQPPRVPTIPGAIVRPPEWLSNSAFDVESFFRMPPDADNAAPLYLDALLEFSPDVATCFPWGEPERTASARSRFERLHAVYDKWNANPSAVTLQEIEDCLEPLAEGFRKIGLAQGKKSCVFAIGLSFEALLPHAQAMRTVARALTLKTQRDLRAGDLDAAVGNVATVLRLSRDLRPRGMIIVQLVSSSIAGSTVTTMALPILRHPKVGTDQCRRLVEILREYDRTEADAYRIGIEGECILVTTTLCEFLAGRKFVPGPDGEAVVETDEAIDRRVEQAKAEGKNLRHVDLRPLAEGFAAQGIDLEGEFQLCDDFTKGMIDVASSVPSEQIKTFDRLTKALPLRKEPKTYGIALKIIPYLKPNIDGMAIARALIRGTLCAAALRLWQLEMKTEPDDLGAVCRAAGLDRVPIDPYSNEPIHLAKLGGESIVYSLGQDEKDDKGLIDKDFVHTKPGDYVFKLK
jgi:hypothetical protein